MTLIKKATSAVLIWSLILIVSSCGNGSNSEFEYIKLDNCDFELSELPEGTSLTVISFSGGRLCDIGTTIYYQFIAVDSTGKDTIRVISPCQNYTFDINNLEASYSSLASLAAISKDFYKEDNKKLVVFNRRQAFLEQRNYKTVIGLLGFLPRE